MWSIGDSNPYKPKMPLIWIHFLLKECPNKVKYCFLLKHHY
nr:MAG TPA: 5-carboxymethyl-2-hydroxymuconate isomerase [Crassvirales sp.]